MKPMQAMIWKEIRQNLPWTGFLFVASAGAFAYAVKHAPAGYIYSDEPVLGQAFCLVSRLGFLGLAGVLGLLGTVFDSRPDAWAFLVHRPEPRTTIFWSKLLAAWIAYLLVAGLPLAGAIIWIMQTERLGRPFYWEMGLVHIADLFAGAAAVPLGMIVGLRPARWYAGRGIPLLAMFLGIGLAELTREFWHCVPLLTFWGAVVVWAARGVFVAGVSGNRAKGLGGAALAIVMFVGLLSISMFFMAMLGFKHAKPSIKRSMTVYSDGKAIVVESNHLDNAYCKVRYADGTPSALFENLKPGQDIGFSRDAGNFERSMDHWQRYFYWDKSDQAVHLSFFRDTVDWYYLAGEKRIVGYSMESHRLIGSVGPGGFAESEVKEAFTGQLLAQTIAMTPHSEFPPNATTLVFDKAIYEFDSKARTMRLLFLAGPPGEKR